MIRLRSLVVVVLAASAQMACSASNDNASVADGADQEANGAVTVLAAKLYDDPRAQPDDFCDVYTQLTVSKLRSGKITAKLENRLSGQCEIHVAPNPRSFTVTQSESCGSTIYQSANGANALKVQDNRTRMCEDIRPSVLEVEETINGNAQKLYGSPTATGGGGGGPTSQVLSVKLYEEPNAERSASCDHYTKLVIGREGSKLVANVKYELSPTSTCEIAIQPNPRNYDLTESESCGSKVYAGQSGSDQLRVQDNRSRLCEDIRPDVIEVRETRGGGEASYYGKP